MSGVLITVEGPDGAGKTTLIRQLLPVLQKRLNRNILSTREPGGNMIAEKIRHLILDPTHIDMDERTEALLYAAARRQHLVYTVLPALETGDCVICDRFVDSSIAYQGKARHIGVSGIIAINDFATQGKQPDLTFYIDIPVEEGLKRIYNHRLEEVNRLDLENISFHEAVRQGYLDLLAEYPERIVKLDGLCSTDVLVEQCVTIIMEKFPNL